MFDKCRTCLKSEGNLIDLKSPERLHLVSKWTALTNFEWIVHEKLELFICERCVASLDFSYDFQQQCIESNTAYERVLRNLSAIEQTDYIVEELEKVDDKVEVGEDELLVEEREDVKGAVIKLVSSEARIIEESKVKVENEISIEEDDDPLKEEILVLVEETENEKEQQENPESELFTCESCEKDYPSKQAYQVHIRNIHNAKGKFKCDFCTRTFNRMCHKQEHLRTHTQEKPYICSICGKTYRQSSSLRTHMRLHGKREAVCNVCQKSFVRSSQLKLHMRNHTGDRPYLCTVCGSRFTQSGHLNVHLATHGEEKPYACDICGKRFKISSYASVHRRIHLETKKFKCSVCGYGFHQLNKLEVHMKTHGSKANATVTTKHCKKQHVCQICRKRFSQDKSLKAHMSTKHDVVVEVSK